MKTKTKKKILYFVDGIRPSKAQLAEGKAVKACFRNARYCNGVKPERCDAVMGAVPKEYSEFENLNKPKPAPKKKAAKKVAKDPDPMD